MHLMIDLLRPALNWNGIWCNVIIRYHFQLSVIWFCITFEFPQFPHIRDSHITILAWLHLLETNFRKLTLRLHIRQRLMSLIQPFCSRSPLHGRARGGQKGACFALASLYDSPPSIMILTLIKEAKHGVIFVHNLNIAHRQIHQSAKVQ